SLTILAELVSRFHEEAARSSERLDGLDAAVVWAGQHTCDLERCEHIDQRAGLLRASLVQRTQAIVADPLRALAGARVTDDEQAQAQTAWARLRRRFHAFGRSARAWARRARSRSISRPAASPEPTPRARRTAFRMRSSATTASWCAPTTSWNFLAAETTRSPSLPSNCDDSSVA